MNSDFRTDIFGHGLSVGDIVATTNWGNHKTESRLRLGKVVGFSKKKIRIQYLGDNTVVTKWESQIVKRHEANLFKDSEDYLLNNLGMSLEDAIETAKTIYEEEISRMDY